MLQSHLPLLRRRWLRGRLTEQTEDVVLSVIRAVADYIFQHEAVFVYLYEKQYDIEKA